MYESCSVVYFLQTKKTVWGSPKGHWGLSALLHSHLAASFGRPEWASPLPDHLNFRRLLIWISDLPSCYGHFKPREKISGSASRKGFQVIGTLYPQVPLGEIRETLVMTSARMSLGKVGGPPALGLPFRSFPLCSGDFPSGPRPETRKQKLFDLFILKPE